MQHFQLKNKEILYKTSGLIVTLLILLYPVQIGSSGLYSFQMLNILSFSILTFARFYFFHVKKFHDFNDSQLAIKHSKVLSHQKAANSLIALNMFLILTFHFLNISDKVNLALSSCFIFIPSAIIVNNSYSHKPNWKKLLIHLDLMIIASIAIGFFPLLKS